ncbi:MAG: glycosyl transferase family 36 [Peptococcaceae bacterium]|nr:glycosyl transferase family 36 [Peptococcaceae bacterium]
MALDKINSSADLLLSAGEMARLHHYVGTESHGQSLRAHVQNKSTFIEKSYTAINEYYYQTDDLIPAAEWYLDNYYLIQELMGDLQKSLTTTYESRLLYLKGSHLKGYPRIYVLIENFMEMTDGHIDIETLKEFVDIYQKENPLVSAEIWAIPLILKIVILERICKHIEQILYIQQERQLAEKWLDSVLHGSAAEYTRLGRGLVNVDDANDVLKQPAKAAAKIPSMENPAVAARYAPKSAPKEHSTVFLDRVGFLLREVGPDAKLLLNWLDKEAGRRKQTLEAIREKEQYFLSLSGLSMGNLLSSIKKIGAMDWSYFFETVSLVQRVLRDDPSGTYELMDFESRDKYRHEVESLAERYNLSELRVAQLVKELAATKPENPQRHIGYYLLGHGRQLLEVALLDYCPKGKRWRIWPGLFVRRHNTASYLGFISVCTLLITVLLHGVVSGFGGLWSVVGPMAGAATDVWPLGASIAGWLAICVVVLGIVVFGANTLVCRFTTPSFLPKMDFGKGIPPESKTLVVIPVIYNSRQQIKAFFSQLEKHYLRNKDPQLFFALIGDFEDSVARITPAENKLIDYGVTKAHELNRKYSTSQFFFFHRDRTYNEREKVWMGWERKRGKLIELNRVLLGEAPPSFLRAGDFTLLQGVRYVISLDADTILPGRTAIKLIGALAHPLQEAHLDPERTKVVSGFGLLQPRVGISVESAFETPFAHLFSGNAGIDPYTCAISDVYQDLFGDGIFTGKGIYDLEVFHTLTQKAFPDNLILSHDLIESLYVKTGLATDIELIDGYPKSYLSYAKRLHRWIRGDWQIARFFFAKHLSAISKWKIFDNLRRSLEAPAQLTLLTLGLLFPRAQWLCFGLIGLCLIFPLLLSVVFRLQERSLFTRYGGKDCLTQLRQVGFEVMVLSHRALTQVDAIVRSLYRQWTRRKLLEWESAAKVDRQLKNTLGASYRGMAGGVILGLAVCLWGFGTSPVVSVVLAALWLLGPWVVYVTAKPYRNPSQEAPGKEDHLYLRWHAWKIWGFFLVFVNKINNYLPPDNVQLEPYRGVAHRTSPTNIGLAMLANLEAYYLGYLTLSGLLRRTRLTLKTLDKLDKWNGHFYNWYRTDTLQPLYPVYISTVDSGNLAGYLLTLTNGFEHVYSAYPLIAPTVLEGLRDACTDSHLEGSYQQELAELSELCAKRGYVAVRELDEMLAVWQDRFKAVRPKSSSPLGADEKSAALSFDSLTALLMMIKALRKEIARFFPAEFLDAAAARGWAIPEGMPLAAMRIHYFQCLQQLTKSEKTEDEDLGRTQIDVSDRDLALKKCLKKVLRNIVNAEFVSYAMRRHTKGIVDEMDFKPLLEEQRNIFTIGYNVSEQKLDKSYYDLLASEARLSSFIAIAKGDVEESHWFKLARPLTRIDGQQCLLSWSGTAFEFLMPLIIMKNFKGTLLDESYRSMLKIQQNYARKSGVPWGISESGFYAFDVQNNYQYKAFGVPGIGLKRGLPRDLVITPYATFMGLTVDRPACIENLRAMQDEGFEGPYGLYEAADYTPGRVRHNHRNSVVKSYMAHHQGMSLGALVNALNNNILQERFHREPMIKSIELLLQEQLPTQDYSFSPIIEEVREKKVAARTNASGEKPVVYTEVQMRLPQPHFISNREYSVMLTPSGSGYSKLHNMAFSRWRQDPVLDTYGNYIYVHNLNSGEFWSATYKPCHSRGDEYRVFCFPNSVRFQRRDGNIATSTEIWVTPDDPVELRTLTLTNHSKYYRDVETTSYFELVLNTFEADLAHPAFSNLFIKTGFENNCIYAYRRSRDSEDKQVFGWHSLISDTELTGDLQYETDRAKFIGRNGTLADPYALGVNIPLSNTTGSILDPIMSLRARVRLMPGQTAKICYLSGVASCKEDCFLLAEKYKRSGMLDTVKELSWSQSLMELSNMGLSFADATLYARLAAQLVYADPLQRRDELSQNKNGQSLLWSVGISGDLSIVILQIGENRDLVMLEQMLRIHEYWKVKGFYVDLVILSDEESGYRQNFLAAIQERIDFSHARKLVNRPGGVFLLQKDQLAQDLLTLLFAVARMIFASEEGSLRNQINKMVRKSNEVLSSSKNPAKVSGKLLGISALPLMNVGYGGHSFVGHGQGHGHSQGHGQVDQARRRGEDRNTGFEPRISNMGGEKLFDNGYGGFSADGRSYLIDLPPGRTTPLPWSNIIANKNFGFLISESGGGYTWSQNSREYKLSPWYNDALLDTSGEALFLQDLDTRDFWSPTPQPAGTPEHYNVSHSHGATVFEHVFHGVWQETAYFVDKELPIKYIALRLKNLTAEPRRLAAYYYIEWVLGVDRAQSAPYLVVEEMEGSVLARSVYQDEFAGRTAFLTGYGGTLRLVSRSRRDFLGVNGSLGAPKGLMDGVMGEQGNDCGVVTLECVVEPGAEHTLVFALGDCASMAEAKEMVGGIGSAEPHAKALNAGKKFWSHMLNTLQVETPDKGFDIMFNSWLLYQTLCCRIWSRAAYYQCGGAFGFRDQLQDSMAFSVVEPRITREQILIHAARQFPEGDAQHWWHSETGKGIRTKFSDDRLWLPYVVADYIEHTRDWSVLAEQVGFLAGDLLTEEEDERYFVPEVSPLRTSVYDHCLRAIDISMELGPHGLPLIGTGDWNDGLSAVGRLGTGESVWMAWFFISILRSFAPICRRMDDDERAERYLEHAEEVLKNVEKNAWDGSWYRRAYFDDGTPLGSATAQECQIDSISQSWAVITGGGSATRAQDAMVALENYLWDKEASLLKLLTPPFDMGEPHPGYIRGYLPGVRENGGQYTHAAIWAVSAYCHMGDGDRAWTLLRDLIPIFHARTDQEARTYKVEPYVVSADVYSEGQHLGRGGWSWYTGASGWMYQVMLEGILGFHLRGDELEIRPCLPREWPDFNLRFRFRTSDYIIYCDNKAREKWELGNEKRDEANRRWEAGCEKEDEGETAGREEAVSWGQGSGRDDHVQVRLDGANCSFPVKLVDDGKTHVVEVMLN